MNSPQKTSRAHHENEHTTKTSRTYHEHTTRTSRAHQDHTTSTKRARAHHEHISSTSTPKTHHEHITRVNTPQTHRAHTTSTNTSAQQLTWLDFTNVPHLRHGIVLAIIEVMTDVPTDVLIGVWPISSCSGYWLTWHMLTWRCEVRLARCVWYWSRWVLKHADFACLRADPLSSTKLTLNPNPNNQTKPTNRKQTNKQNKQKNTTATNGKMHKQKGIQSKSKQKPNKQK